MTGVHWLTHCIRLFHQKQFSPWCLAHSTTGARNVVEYSGTCQEEYK
jgi:hypothetical protein